MTACINCGAPDPWPVEWPWSDVFGSYWCPIGMHEVETKESRR